MRYFYTSTREALVYSACGNLISQDNFTHHRRTFDQNVLILVQEGTLYLSQSGQNFVIGPDQYILLRAGEEHFGYQASSGKLCYLWAHFSCAETFSVTEELVTDSIPGSLAYSEPIREMTYCIPETGTISCTKRALLLFQQLLDYSRQLTLYNPDLLNYSSSLLLMELSQEYLNSLYNQENHISPTLDLIMEWIRVNCYRPITIHDIAKEFGYNADYLSRLFKKSCGMTLIQFLNRSRVEISRTLLANNHISIKEAAYTCGFSDEKYYMRVFKKIEGMTPTEYRNAFHQKRLN